MTNQTAASPSERAIKVACERLQWGESTPSAFVLEWARTLDSFARVEVLRGALREAEWWSDMCDHSEFCTSNDPNCRACIRIADLQAQLKEAEEGVS